MNPLFNQPQVPAQSQGMDFQVAPQVPQAAPAPQGIVPQNVGQDPLAPAPVDPALQRQAIQPFQQPAPQAAPPVPPKIAAQNAYAQQHEPVRQMNDDMMKYFASPQAKAFQSAIKGVDWDSLHSDMDTHKKELAEIPPNLGYVVTMGGENAIKTAFKGGSYMDIAASMLGKSEGKDHAVISSFIEKSMGQKVDPQQTPWCAAFANSVLQAGGVKGTGSLAARSFLKFGTEVKNDEASKGDVVVFGRQDPTHGHVGFIDHFSKDGKTVFVLGGNQNDSVSISARPASQILGIRRPPTGDEIKKHAEEVGMERRKVTEQPAEEPKQDLPPLVNPNSANVKYT